MAGTKATRHPTKTDTLIRTVDQSRQARGLDRHRIIPRVTQLPSGGGNNPAGGQHVGASGNFLDPTGDTMIGPIAFFPETTAINQTDDSIDIGIQSGDYTSYILVTPVGSPDDLVTIFGASFAGQLLYMQGTQSTQIVLKNGDSGNSGNIVTGTGGDLIINDASVVTLLFDVTISPSVGIRGAWRVISGGSAAQSNLIAGLSANSNPNLPAVDNFVVPWNQNFILGDQTKIQATATAGVFQLSDDVFALDALIQLEGDETGSGSGFVLTWQESDTEVGGYTNIPIPNARAGALEIGRPALSSNPHAIAIRDYSGIVKFVRVNILIASGTLVTVFSASSSATIDTGGGGGGGSGGGSTTLGGLSDVTLTSPTLDQVLTFDGTIWRNQSPTAGSMATDLSNMISPTIPTVPLSMNSQDIDEVNSLDFANVGSRTITSLSNLNFFQTGQEIDSLAGVLLYQVDVGQQHLFAVGGASGIRVADIGGGVIALELFNHSIDDVKDINFDGNAVIPTNISGIGRNTSEATPFMQYNVGAVAEFHRFEIVGNPRLLVDNNGIKIEGTATTDILQLNPGGSVSLIAGRFRSDGTDIFAFSGGEERNLSDIGGSNTIFQANSAVTVLDTGAGSVTVQVDGSIKSSQDVNNLLLLTNVDHASFKLTSLGDTTPSGNHATLFGSGTTFWANVYTDRITLQNTANNIIGSSTGLEYNAQSSGKHQFDIGATTIMSLLTDRMSMGKTIDSNGTDIIDVRDLIMNNSASILDMNNGNINAVTRLTMASGGDIFMNSGDIFFDDGDLQDVRQLNMISSGGGFINMKAGNIFNVGDIDIEDEFRHESGGKVGFFGVTPVSVPVMSRATSGDSLGVLIARFQILQDILSQRLQASSGNPSGTGIIELFGF